MYSLLDVCCCETVPPRHRRLLQLPVLHYSRHFHRQCINPTADLHQFGAVSRSREAHKTSPVGQEEVLLCTVCSLGVCRSCRQPPTDSVPKLAKGVHHPSRSCLLRYPVTGYHHRLCQNLPDNQIQPTHYTHQALHTESSPGPRDSLVTHCGHNYCALRAGLVTSLCTHSDGNLHSQASPRVIIGADVCQVDALRQ